jgi:hypothetical protein
VPTAEPVKLLDRWAAKPWAFWRSIKAAAAWRHYRASQQ